MNQNINTWLKQNLITLLILFAGMVMAWSSINSRVDALENKVSQYPSEDWFELKFSQLEEDIATNTKLIEERLLPNVIN